MRTTTQNRQTRPDYCSADAAGRPTVCAGDAARAWLVELNSGSISPERGAAFERWLDASREHRLAMANAARLWRDIGLLEGVSERDRAEDASADKTPYPWRRRRSP